MRAGKRARGESAARRAASRVVCRLPVPARGGPAGGALVPAATACRTAMLKNSLAERGIEVDHVTIYRWVQRFTPLVIEAARPRRHACAVTGGSWMRPTFEVGWGLAVRRTGRWTSTARVIDVFVSKRRNAAAAQQVLRGRCWRAVAHVRERSPRIWLHRCFVLSMSWFRTRFTTPSSIRTIVSRTTTAGSRPG